MGDKCFREAVRRYMRYSVGGSLARRDKQAQQIDSLTCHDIRIPLRDG